MKIQASVFPVWDPWDGMPPEFDDIFVSISIDSLDFDKNADVKILYLVEPYEILPALKKKAPQVVAKMGYMKKGGRVKKRKK